MTKSRLIDLDKEDCPAYVTVFNKLYDITKSGGRIDRNTYYKVCNDNQVDTVSFVMDCSDTLTDNMAIVRYKDKGLSIYYSQYMGNFDFDKIEIFILDKE